MAQNQKTDAFAGVDPSSLPDLNDQQMDFVVGILQGMTGADAYRRAYGCHGWSPAAVIVAASRLRHSANVALWVQAARLGCVQKAVVTLESHLAELDSIAEEARASGNYGAAVNALVSKGKAAGLYIDRHMDLTDRRTVDPESIAAAIDPTKGEVYNRILGALPVRPAGATVQ